MRRSDETPEGGSQPRYESHNNVDPAPAAEDGAGSRRARESQELIDPGTVDRIRLHYRLSKAAEGARIKIDHGLVSYVRVHLTAWQPDLDEKARKREAVAARAAVKALLGGKAGALDVPLAANAAGLVLDIAAARHALLARDNDHRREAERLAKALPAWRRIGHVKGFSAWGLAVLVGEAGDVGLYSGCRKLYKRFGLCPDDCYPKGEKKTGRKIPRGTRGRLMGIVADPLFRAQWRGEKDVIPAHAIGPYGAVYADAKARRIARVLAGERGEKEHAHTLKTGSNGWADKGARRAMVKALLHDVWCAWHGAPLRYAEEGEDQAGAPEF